MTACLKAKAAAARGVPISTQAVCCGYYRCDPSPLQASRVGAVASVRPVLNNLSTLSSGPGSAGDAAREHCATSAAATATSAGQARNKSTAALMEENDHDVGREAMVGREASGVDSLTSFRLTGEREDNGYQKPCGVIQTFFFQN